jgi:hypothetical protein
MKRVFLFSIFALAGMTGCNRDDNTVKLTDITVAPQSISLLVNGSRQLTATPVPSSMTDVDFQWSSADNTVAVVSNDGMVTAKSVGSTEVTVSSGAISKSVSVSVAPGPVSLEDIALSQSAVEIAVSNSVTVTATPVPDNALVLLKFTWTSSNENVATVTQDGIITAHREGSATITVSSDEIRRTVAVTVKKGIWQLHWEDNFDGNALNSSNWEKIPRQVPGWGKYLTNYDGCYDVIDGKLILRGLVNDCLPTDNAPFLTGGVWTNGKVKFSRGRLEIRAKLGSAQGAWPAFWMLPADNSSWPNGGEIDIMERLHFRDFASSTVHSYYTYTLKITNPPQSASGKIDTADFNMYVVEMYADSLSFYINDTHTLTYPRIKTDKPGQFPFDRDYHLILDMQLGDWVGEVNPAHLPVEMWIDWVRFYKKGLP